MFSNILVHIPSERPVRPVIDVAVALTMAGKSHLDGVALGYESMSAVGMVAEGGGAAVAAVMGFEQERALERANAAIAVFEVEARLARIAHGTRAFAAIPAEAGQIIGELARLYDLAVHQPDIQVVGANLAGDRTLTLRHNRYRGIPLAQNTKEAVLKHIRRLWGYSVVLEEPET